MSLATILKNPKKQSGMRPRRQATLRSILPLAQQMNHSASDAERLTSPLSPRQEEVMRLNPQPYNPDAVQPHGFSVHALQQRMIQDAELLSANSPKMFASYLEQVKKLNESSIETHSLSFVIGSNAYDPYLNDLILAEGVYLSESERD